MAFAPFKPLSALAPLAGNKYVQKSMLISRAQPHVDHLLSTSANNAGALARSWSESGVKSMITTNKPSARVSSVRSPVVTPQATTGAPSTPTIKT